MLHGYRFTLAQMGEIKNWKRKNKFEALLLAIDDVFLSTHEVDCRIKYKKTVPLNMFEKYSLRLIEKADAIYSDIDMNIKNIAKLLNLDENLIEKNLANLDDIGMLHGLKSDSITINKDEASEYLRYENKFKIESLESNYHLTESEFNDCENYIQRDYDKKSEQEGSKFKSIDIINTKESTKGVHVLHYADNSFRIFSSNGINAVEDLKFIEKDTLNTQDSDEPIPENVFCHYDEFLPLLRDQLSMNRDDIVIISTQDIENDSMDVLMAGKHISDTFILTGSDTNHKRVFDIDIEDCVWIGEHFFKKVEGFIVEVNDEQAKLQVQQKINEYFLSRILEIEPSYDMDKLVEISKNIDTLNETLNGYKFKNKKVIEDETKRLRTERNKLYGLESKSPKSRSELRKKIDKYELSNNTKELEQYPEYRKNRKLITKLNNKVLELEKEQVQMDDMNRKINALNSEKSSLVSPENKQKIAPLEEELKKLKRLRL